ncbi:unnamed protein product [Chondrus crispus]|uniref:Signal recognition particle 19 kDa protein n=1 Tax=Chondrus crispus TaxID=2769 RepID=R7Q4M7_CHOCR|nr:unnamed protein product [Chondrus crispus]CDF32415.1 unnamed protein product [Chondrus crispus]|eukprot:XP_005712080.1 unnamed protein product [Chondrus crispus]
MSKIPALLFAEDYGPDVDPRRWVVIYPPYLDKLRTEAQGRKIAKDKCVENPTIKEVFDCAQLLKFQTALALNKAYCRDSWARGLVRIKLFDEVGKPVREDIPNRRTLYAKVAELIPKHREQVMMKEGKKGGNKGGGASASKKTVTGKGAPAPTKKKKKGKR